MDDKGQTIYVHNDAARLDFLIEKGARINKRIHRDKKPRYWVEVPDGSESWAERRTPRGAIDAAMRIRPPCPQCSEPMLDVNCGDTPTKPCEACRNEAGASSRMIGGKSSNKTGGWADVHEQRR